MNVIHVMRNEKFTMTVSKMYNDSFGDKHSVLYLNDLNNSSIINNSYKMKQFEFFLANNKGFHFFTANKIVKVLKQYDLIVLHSFCLNKELIILFNRYNLFKKTIWIEWGADLYEWDPNGKESLIRRLSSALRLRIINNLKGIVAIFPPDMDTIKVFEESLRSTATAFKGSLL